MIGRHTRLVMRREFAERSRDRGVYISAGVMTAIILVVVVIAGLTAGKDKTPHFTVAFAGPDAAVEQTAAVNGAQLAGIRITASAVSDTAAATADVKSGKLSALVQPGSVTVKESLDPKLGAILQAVNQSTNASRNLAAAGIDPAQVAKAADVPPLATAVLSPKDPHAGERKGVALAAAILLFGQLAAYGYWVASGVVEEKSSRVVEVVLATVPARSLLAGKILGIGLLGFLQLLLTVTVGLAGGVISGAIHVSGTALQAAGLALGWFALGYVFYASAYAATASRVSRQEEMNSAIQPLSLLLTMGYLAIFPAVGNPNAGWVRIVSLIPPLSTLLQPVRIAGGDASWWEPVLAIGLMMTVTFFMVRIAARIYENSVLRFGTKVGLKAAWAASKKA